MEKRIFIKCEDHDIPMVLVYPDEGSRFPAVLMLHGFMAYKEGDGYMFRIGAEKLKEAGIASARIDFCSMGENRCSRRKYGLEMLLKETKCAFQYLSQDPAVDPERICIMGHSLGGRVAFLSADLPSRCIVTLNGAVNIAENLPMKNIDNDFMQKNGYCLIETSDGRTELLFPKFIKDMQECQSRTIYSYQNPILVVIGRNDPTLDPNIGYRFVQTCGMKNVEELDIDGANHTFNAKTGDYTKLNEMYDKVIVWLKEKL